MNSRKIILYPKSAMKPVIISDVSDSDIEEIQSKIMKSLSSNKISIIDTSNDILIFRPSEIQAIMITKKENNNNLSDSDLIESKDKESKK